MTKQEFQNLCKENGLILDEKQMNQLDSYLKLIQKYNEVMNLTGITEENEVYEKHFYDSILFSFGMKMDGLSLIDVGTGAGFPGVVLAICYPSLKVDLLEPLTKRCVFLECVQKELCLENVTIINKRSEDYSKENKEKYDIATARAVAKLNILLEISSQMIKTSGYFIALKGKIGEEEIDEAKNALKTLSFKIENVKKDSLPSNNDVRMNVFVKKVGATPLKYPRNFGQIKKHPL